MFEESPTFLDKHNRDVLVTSQRTLHEVTVCQLLRSQHTIRLTLTALSSSGGLAVCVLVLTRRRSAVRGFDPGHSRTLYWGSYTGSLGKNKKWAKDANCCATFCLVGRGRL